MVKTQYFTATSADGFIADQNDSLKWLFEVPRDHDDGAWEDFIAGVSVMAMGATTYEWVLDHDDLLENPGTWQEYYGDRPCWVFSHRELPTIAGADLRFVSGDATTVHAQMAEAAAGGNIWLVGGGDLVGQFDDAGLLDEIHLGLQPVFLGDGAPLLPRRLTSERVHLRTAHQVGQTIRIVYEVQPRPGS
jgi:dihydrofolate reductase